MAGCLALFTLSAALWDKSAAGVTCAKEKQHCPNQDHPAGLLHHSASTQKG